MNQTQLKEHAKWLAETQKTFVGDGHDVLLHRLSQNEAVLIHSYRIVEDAARAKQRIVPAAVWLLDNFYILEEQIWMARRHLPKSYSIQLPRVEEGEFTGFPRVYALISELIQCNDGIVDEPSIQAFVDSYQESNPLLIGELWAVPVMLRFALLQNARHTAARIATGAIDRHNANHWADRIAKIEPTDTSTMLQVMADLTASQPRMSGIFIAEFARRLQTQNPAPALPMGWLEQHLIQCKRSFDEIFHHESHQEAADQVNMSHTITSLRTLESIDWRTFVERSSGIESILKKDPAKVYETMDFATRDRYRHAVEDLAKKHVQNELAVAQMAINLCHDALKNLDPTDRRSHVGYYLIDRGRDALETLLVSEKDWRLKVKSLWCRNLGRVYFAFVFFTTVIVTAWMASTSIPQPLAGWSTLLLVIASMIVASQPGLTLANWFATMLVKPKRLPRLDFSKGIPLSSASIVVVPTMLSSPVGIERLLQSLEVSYLGNRDPNVHFALLTDFVDSKLESCPDDESLLNLVSTGVTKLNAKYQKDSYIPFYLFHRPRRWNPTERLWMGYERKRGKLMEFAEVLRGGDFGRFSRILGDQSVLQNIKYVITLDTDTRLPHDTARQMIAAMAHPLNHPVVDINKGRVVDGYTILQPRVAVELQSANRTWFTKLFAGDPGIDPYTREISDVYQDLFGEGSFVGKGIFEVDTFLSTLRERFPENWILSHDLIESCVARSGLISDVLLHEQFPAQYQADISRRHRWIRGDWQIAPWLIPWAKKFRGAKEQMDLSGLSRWKIADNLRRSLLPVAMVLTLILGWTTTDRPAAWSVFVLGVIFLPCFLTTIQKTLTKPADNDWYSHLTQIAQDVLIRSIQSILSVIFLPYEAWKNIDAIARALFRMTIGKRRLLEWRPAHEVEHAIDGSLGGQLRAMGPLAFLIVLLFILPGASDFRAFPPTLFFSFWIMAPFAAWLISKPINEKPVVLPADDQNFLSDIAKKTWSYFDTYVTEAENWLPPDNVQFSPEEIIAHRTSPTNIGLYLLSSLAALDFGFITIDQLLQRLESSLSTMEKLERFKGHFYNWYDTRTLKPLAPSYISTVDSGNLTACLYTIASALEQLEADAFRTHTQAIRERLKSTAQKSRELGTCDYAFLYNKSRRLLAIGYNVHDQRLDSSYYDLLASEARLASIFGIALGQLPVEHWYALGRLMNRIGKERILLSWSGSMFEYLMPMLILPDYEDTLLSETHKAAVKCQVAYGKIRGVPWGFSESGYFATDIHSTYQYRAFGVPGLGFKRGLGQDLVVAPYASMMAIMVDPVASCANLRRLHNEGFTGAHGFYEAIDYTTSRIPPQQPHAVVRSFMAHHQGMGFLALAYYLLGKPMQRRFLKSPLFQSVAILLEEGRPKTAPFPLYGTEAPEEVHTSHEREGAIRITREPNPAEPSIQLLSNGSYHVMIGAAGEGYSALGETLVNRYHADSTQRSDGIFCYLRNLSNGQTWSTAYQPSREQPTDYEVIFTEGKAEFKRRDGSIETHTEITVSPEHNLEIRRVRLTNRGRTTANIELTSFMEIALANARSDEAHPAFSKLFLRTEIVKSHKGIICQRRPRLEGELCPWIFHSVVVHGTSGLGASYETDRYQFIGRGRDLHEPLALSQTLSGTDGYVLDPIFSIRKTIPTKPFETVTVDLIFGEGRDRSDCLELMSSFRERISADRIFELSWAQSQVMLQQLNIDAPKAQIFNRIAGYILYPHASQRVPARGSSNAITKGQSGLWGYGISGDLPMILLRLSRTSQIGLLRELVIAHTYWRRKGLATDLVIWNEDESSYRQQLHDEIQGAIAHMGANTSIGVHGGIFVLRPDQIIEEDRRLIQSAARISMNALDGSSLVEQLTRKAPFKPRETARHDARVQPISKVKRRDNIVRAIKPPRMNSDGTEYQISVSAGNQTPLPWVNVIANPSIGTVISERGSSYTWFENAHEFRLTPWHNDPVSDTSGEAFYIQDTSTGLFWSPMPWPIEGDGDYLVRHGFGYSVFEHTSSGIRSETWVFVDAEESVKYVMIRLHNESGRRRYLSVTGVCDWVLGDHRSRTAMHITTEAESGVIFARNSYLIEGGERTAFFSANGASTWSADRQEILGDLRDWRFPAAMYKTTLSGRTGSGLDPCAALRVPLVFESGASREVVFMLGAGADRHQVRELAKIATTIRPPAKVLRTVRQVWRDRLSRVTIETPDTKLNALANGWLLYQTISSRIFARSGFYQSGGAFGFRDQLQDVMALVHHEPAMTRAHILRCSEQQFLEGDVLHWWHPPSGRGIRTCFSDDYLWLPLVTAHYVERTGDQSILDETRHFIEGQLLKPGEESHYGRPNRSERSASVYEHCLLAIKNGLKFGTHGLPLMGCGDWNDGMNLVGIKGKGESVWLAFFLYHVLGKFQKLAEIKHDTDTVKLCENQRSNLLTQIDQHAWDGNWYLRAFFDDGTPLGSVQSPECRIDLLPQSWAVLSGAAPPDKMTKAMDAVEEQLINREAGLIQLFEPPFQYTRLNPGYIKGYPPGVRENGGQYTHAAIWAIWAFAKTGDYEKAWNLLEMINPLRRDSTLAATNRYMTEPYVVAADVYSKSPHAGRGGWTWYTGAAGWMHQLILEGLLGVVRQGDQLRVNPTLRKGWDGYAIRYQYKSANYHIQVCRKKGANSRRLIIDGSEQTTDVITLVDDGMNHLVIIEVESVEKQGITEANAEVKTSSEKFNSRSSREQGEPAAP